MTQPNLFALTDGEHSGVTEGGMAVELAPVPKGAIVERRFEIAALERGYEVAVNIGGGKDFDHIVRLPLGRPVVVQEKTGIWRPRTKHYDITNCSGGKVYSMHAYDVLAVYLPDRQRWVFYRRAELGQRTGTTYTPPEFRINATRANAPDARDPDNWELLDQVAAMYSQESLGVTQQMSDPLPNTQ